MFSTEKLMGLWGKFHNDQSSQVLGWGLPEQSRNPSKRMSATKQAPAQARRRFVRCPPARRLPQGACPFPVPCWRSVALIADPSLRQAWATNVTHAAGTAGWQLGQTQIEQRAPASHVTFWAASTAFPESAALPPLLPFAQAQTLASG